MNSWKRSQRARASGNKPGGTYTFSVATTYSTQVPIFSKNKLGFKNSFTTRYNSRKNVPPSLSYIERHTRWVPEAVAGSIARVAHARVIIGGVVSCNAFS